jgi:hypothetical protein
MFMLLWLFIVPVSVNAADYYIDPDSGSDGNPGSAAMPWKSLQHLFDEGKVESRNWDSLPYSDSSFLVVKNQGALVKGGDTIYLRSGKYGELNISGYYNEHPISIVAEQGHIPLFRNIILRSAANWKLSGLTVNASLFPEDSFSTLISLESHGWSGPVEDVEVSHCKLASVSDSSTWNINDWNTRAKNGISASGTNMIIAGNSLLNVNFGISVGASHSVVKHNLIENFAGDGLRGLGDYTTFEYNTVKNCYDVNDNHDDGFQSWSVGSDGRVGTGVVKGIVLRGNTIINFEDPNQPFKGTLQGIGCFDGMFEGWLVEDNRIEVDHWHGISLYGATDTIVRGNIVTDPNGPDNIGPPWIMLRAHKNDTPSQNCQVSCNISPKLIVSDEPSIINEYNIISDTGGPGDPHCRSFKGLPAILLPLILDSSTES